MVERRGTHGQMDRRRRLHLLVQGGRGLLFDLLGRDRLLGEKMANRTGVALVRPPRASLARGSARPMVPTVPGPAATLMPGRNGQAPARGRCTGRFRPARPVAAVDVEPSPGSDRQKIGGQDETRGCGSSGGHRFPHVGGHAAKSLSIIRPRAPRGQAWPPARGPDPGTRPPTRSLAAIDRAGPQPVDWRQWCRRPGRVVVLRFR